MRLQENEERTVTGHAQRPVGKIGPYLVRPQLVGVVVAVL